MPDAFAHLLQRMMREGKLPRSQFSARSLKNLQSLLDAGTLITTRIGGGLAIEVKDPETLATFYRQRYPFSDSIIAGPPRSCAVGMLRNAKRVNRTDLEPVLLRAIGQIVCMRNDIQLNLRALTLQAGAGCLILESGRFWSLATEVAVVENLECFLHFERMRIPAGVVLYAAGRLSDLALQWMGSPEMSQCRFIHCGDYDPVGLDEFLRLKAVVGERATLYVPADLPRLVGTYGRPELLQYSTAVLKRLRVSTDPEVLHVLKILEETGHGLEQEALLLEQDRTTHAGGK